jgi:hypothetical protein
VFGLFRRDHDRETVQAPRSATPATPATPAPVVEGLAAFIAMSSAQASVPPEDKEDKALLERMLAQPPLWHRRLSQAELLRVAAADVGEVAPAPAPLPAHSMALQPPDIAGVWRAEQGMRGMPR